MTMMAVWTRKIFSHLMRERCKDTDGDGIGDNADMDADNDGIIDPLDDFP